MKIKIIGAGVVGQNMKKIFPEASFHDPAKGYIDESVADLAFVCVPTESRADGSCNTDIVEAVLMAEKSIIKCIKSTVPPGFCSKMGQYECNIRHIFNTIKQPINSEAYIETRQEKTVCFSPEYYGGTIHANEPGHDFLIVGGDPLACDTVVRAYREHCHPSLRIYKTDAKTAELVKYMENSFLALKVVFCNEFKHIADKIGVDYDILRELFLADSRVGRSHTWVYDDKPGYGSHCLTKDIPALIRFAESVGAKADLMAAVDSVNKHMRSGNG